MDSLGSQSRRLTPAPGVAAWQAREGHGPWPLAADQGSILPEFSRIAIFGHHAPVFGRSGQWPPRMFLQGPALAVAGLLPVCHDPEKVREALSRVP